MFGMLAITIIFLDVILSSEARNTYKNEKREKRQNAFSPVIPSEVKGRQILVSFLKSVLSEPQVRL